MRDLFLMVGLLFETAKLRRIHLWHSSSSKGATRSAGFVGDHLATDSDQHALTHLQEIQASARSLAPDRPESPGGIRADRTPGGGYIIGVALAEPGSAQEDQRQERDLLRH